MRHTRTGGFKGNRGKGKRIMGVYKKTLNGAALAAAMAAALSGGAQAAENGVLNYPSGAPSVFIGEFPPMPGLFGASQTTYSYADALYDSKGNKLAVPFKLAAESETLRFIASYPAELFGAHLLSQLVIPMVHLDIKVPAATWKHFGFGHRLRQYHNIPAHYELEPEPDPARRAGPRYRHGSGEL